MSSRHEHVDNTANKPPRTYSVLCYWVFGVLMKSKWNKILSFGFLQAFVVIFRVFYSESQAAEVLRRLSPVQQLWPELSLRSFTTRWTGAKMIM